MTAPKKKGPPPPPEPLFLEKTHGSLNLFDRAAAHLSYKKMNLLLNPVFKNTRDYTSLPRMDYILLAAGQPGYFGKDYRITVPKKMKIISPPQSRGGLNKEGYRNVKGLSTGGRVLLKKEGGYLFVEGVTDTSSPVHTNGYFMEFDSGRTVFFAGALRNVDSLRDFLYALRDDGKEIHMAVIDAEAIDIDQATEAIALLQPKLAVLIGGDTIDDQLLDRKLKEQIFYGKLYFAKPGDQIPF